MRHLDVRWRRQTFANIPTKLNFLAAIWNSLSNRSTSWFRVRLNECPRSIQTLSVQVLVYWGSTTLLPKTSSSQTVMQLGSFLSTSTPTQRWRICYTCSVQDLHLDHEPKIRERKILILSLLDISIKGSHPVFFFSTLQHGMVLQRYIIHIQVYFLINVYKFECVYHSICCDQRASSCLHSYVLITAQKWQILELFLAKLAYLQQIQGEEVQACWTFSVTLDHVCYKLWLFIGSDQTGGDWCR